MVPRGRDLKSDNGGRKRIGYNIIIIKTQVEQLSAKHYNNWKQQVMLPREREAEKSISDEE